MPLRCLAYPRLAGCQGSNAEATGDRNTMSRHSPHDHIAHTAGPSPAERVNDLVAGGRERAVRTAFTDFKATSLRPVHTRAVTRSARTGPPATTSRPSAQNAVAVGPRWRCAESCSDQPDRNHDAFRRPPSTHRREPFRMIHAASVKHFDTRATARPPIGIRRGTRIGRNAAQWLL